MAHSIVVDFPNIIICRGDAFWSALKPFCDPECPSHHRDNGWSCRLAWHLDRELLRAVALSRMTAPFPASRLAIMQARAELFHEQLAIAKIRSAGGEAATSVLPERR